jgi:hypothetical protein
MPYPEQECPHCHLALSEYLGGLSPRKYVSVDIPMDVLEAEWVYSLGELKTICKYLNLNRERLVKFNLDSIGG